MIDSLNTLLKKKGGYAFFCSCFANATRITKKVTVPLELNLAKEFKKSKKGFYKYMNKKGKLRMMRAYSQMEGIPW